MIITPQPEQFTISGRTLTMRPLRDRQNIALDQWAQAQLIDAARRSLPENCDAKLWDRVMSLAIRESQRVTWDSSRASRTTHGYARLMFESCYELTAGLTLEQVIDAIETATLDELKQMNTLFRRLNDGGDSKKDENPPQPPQGGQ